MPPLPEFDGVSFRMFRGDSDYPHLAHLITAAAKGEGDDRVETAETIAAGYAHLERSDPARDLVVAEVDGTPVGYTRVWWDQEVDGPRLYGHTCFLDPDFRGRGIGSAFLPWEQARLREVAADHDVPEKLFETYCNDVDTGATALFLGDDYEPVTYDARMVRPSVDDLPDHRLPEGVEIRPVREQDLRPIWEAEVEHFRDHWGFVEQTVASYERFLSFPYNDPTLWKVAWDAEGPVGMVRSFIDTAQNETHDKKLGWTESISTARRWRRRGVAKALIVESIRELASRGMTEVALGVHTENPNGAFDLYAGLGYEVVGRWTTYRKPL